MNYNFAKKAIRIINFQPRNFHTNVLFKKNSILKFQYKIYLENILFVSRSLSKLSPSIIQGFSSDQHKYETLSSTQVCIYFFVRQIDMESIQ